MERTARFLSRGAVLAVLAMLLLVNLAVFPPLQSRWVVPRAEGITGVPAIQDLQFSWTAGQFSHNLAEWSGAACGVPGSGDADCTWSRAGDGSLNPAPIPDGPAGFTRLTLLLDFALPLLYGLFAVGLLGRLWDLVGRNRRWLPVATAAAVAASLSDMIENSLHVWLLRGVETWEQAAAADFSGVAVAAASVFATVKYGLLAIMLTAGAAAVVQRGLGRLRGMPGS